MGINLGTTPISDVKLGTSQVDKIYLGSDLVWSKTAPTPINALKFASAGAQTLGVDTTKLGTISPVFEYSTDSGNTWTSWDVANETLQFGNGTDLYLRGSNTFLAKAGNNYINFVFSTNSPVYCSGNLMHLFDYTQDLTAFPDDSSQSSRGVKYMFQNCTSLVSAPDLPASGLSLNCYYYMFDGCTSLLVPPSLSAASYLPQSCYSGMFRSCHSLASIPEIPALVADGLSCQSMFQSCWAIKLSETQTGEYTEAYTFGFVPTTVACNLMFTGTGGTFNGTPTQQTYYTSNTIIR